MHDDLVVLNFEPESVIRFINLLKLMSNVYI